MRNGDRMSSLQRLGPGPKRQTAHQYVVESLRNAIVEGVLTPGTRLIQAAIAEELEVSTTPVREALQDLAAEGLVRLDPHRGAIVYGFDLAECREIYELRMLLEELRPRSVFMLGDDVSDNLSGMVLIGIGIVINIIGWTDYYRNRSNKSSNK
jgi:DNA-binding transcriptional regulator YhcF (GntR family)